jgi:hypothetical protein
MMIMRGGRIVASGTPENCSISRRATDHRGDRGPAAELGRAERRFGNRAVQRVARRGNFSGAPDARQLLQARIYLLAREQGAVRELAHAPFRRHLRKVTRPGEEEE